MVKNSMVGISKYFKYLTITMVRIIILPIFLFQFLSCQSPKEAPKSIPKSEATSSEQEAIVQTIAEIQNLADSMGLHQNFKNIPVVVISEDKFNRKAQAYCEHRRGGGGLYVAIMKSTMDEYLMLFKPHGKNSFLFMLLVHEFGHCYFGRGHNEETSLSSSGSMVPSSAMMIRSHNLLGMHELSETMKIYYIAEVAGLISPQDLPIQ